MGEAASLVGPILSLFGGGSDTPQQQVTSPSQYMTPAQLEAQNYIIQMLKDNSANYNAYKQQLPASQAQYANALQSQVAQTQQQNVNAPPTPNANNPTGQQPAQSSGLSPAASEFYNLQIAPNLAPEQRDAELKKLVQKYGQDEYNRAAQEAYSQGVYSTADLQKKAKTAAGNVLPNTGQPYYINAQGGAVNIAPLTTSDPTSATSTSTSSGTVTSSQQTNATDANKGQYTAKPSYAKDVAETAPALPQAKLPATSTATSATTKPITAWGSDNQPKNYADLTNNDVYVNNDGTISVWNKSSGSWTQESDVTNANQKNTIDTYKAQKAAGTASPGQTQQNQTIANKLNNVSPNTYDQNQVAQLAALAPKTMYDNPFLQYVDPGDEQSALIEMAKRSASDPSGGNTMQSVIDKTLAQIGGTNYADLIRNAIGSKEDYTNKLYASQADPLKRDEALLEQKNASDLASRGLGGSTIINDVNSVGQKDLMGHLSDLSNKAAVAGNDMYLAGLTSAGNMQNQTGQANANIGNDVANLIAGKQALGQSSQNQLQNAINTRYNQRLTNLNLANAGWGDMKNNMLAAANYPLSVTSNQNPAMQTGAGMTSQKYANDTANAQSQNQANSTAISNIVGAVGKTKNPVTNVANNYKDPYDLTTSDSGSYDQFMTY